MKKLTKLATLLVLVTVLSFTIFSCNNDDDASVAVTIENLVETIDENPTNGDVLGTMQTNGSGNLNFSILSQSPGAALTINASTGALAVADASLFDFETNPVITASITAANAVGPATATFNLTNLNEIGIQNFVVTVDENPTNGQVLGSMQNSGSGSLNYSISSQTPAAALAIDATTGELTVADAALFDFETNAVLTATIITDDASNPATATINLANVNEVTIQDLVVSIDENPVDSQVVGTVQSNGTGTLNFSISSQSPAAALTIDASTGELTVVDPNLFDFETNPVLTATITTDDAISPATVTVNLSDVDEVTFQNLTADIDENPTNGAVVGTLQASSASPLTYTITYQNPANALAINSSTGALTVADETLFDFETNPAMFAVISVSNSIETVSANASIALNDINEVGEYKYGGVIFWIDPASSNNSGLVCAITDQGTDVAWGCQGTLISGTSTSIGSGAANTATIIASCATVGVAADLVSNATIEGFSDWFLPSRSELSQMYLQKATINSTAIAEGGAAFIDSSASRYWSSSESNGNTAWCKYFFNGADAGLNKGAGYFFQARAIRAF